MANPKTDIASSKAALTALYALQTQAMINGDLATQKALGADINDLTFKLTQLRNETINSEDVRIKQINAQLDALTKLANEALKDIDKITAVLSNVIAAAKLIDQVISIATKL